MVCRNVIFSSVSCFSVQLTQDWHSSIRLERPSKTKCAPASGLASETPITDAAVTPEPPPDTIQVSSFVSGSL